MFLIALSNVLLTLAYILPGYLLCRFRKASAEHLTTLSAVLVYILSPCLPVSAFLDLDFSWSALGSLALFFALSFALQSAFMAVLYRLFRRRFADARYRVWNIAAVLGNVGFFGIPIMKALMPDHPEVAGYAATYIISMNILAFTMGVFCLTGEKKHMSLRSALLNPTMLGFAAALPLYMTGGRHYLPEMLVNAVHLLGKMTTPLCMMILGIRLATVPLRTLFSRPLVYGVALSKLLAFPLFCYACAALLPLPVSFRASILILSATPCASIIFNLAELHRSEAPLAANCVLLSTLLCFLTIPPLTLLI